MSYNKFYVLEFHGIECYEISQNYYYCYYSMVQNISWDSLKLYGIQFHKLSWFLDIVIIKQWNWEVEAMIRSLIQFHFWDFKKSDVLKNHPCCFMFVFWPHHYVRNICWNMTDNIGKISKMLKQCYNMLNVEYNM